MIVLQSNAIRLTETNDSTFIDVMRQEIYELNRILIQCSLGCEQL